MTFKGSGKFFSFAVSVVGILALGMAGWAQYQPGPPQQMPPQQQGPPPLPQGAPPPQQMQPQPAQLSPQQVQQLVAPIALYPDPLVAQILAASAYPTQIVEAERFVQQNPNLTGAALAAQVDKQPWDPSVKALTQFPSVLADMDRNISWTSELGDVNYNQQADVMNAIQFMRQQAQQAGNLQNTPQQVVSNQGGNVEIQPANPQVVYVPDYNPEYVYGYPEPLWPGFDPWWDVNGPYLSFGAGYGIGPFFGFGWGWPAWGFDWGHRGLLFARRPYVFQSHAFYNRNAYFHGGYQGVAPFARGDRGFRGYGGPGARPAAPSAGARPGVTAPRAAPPAGRAPAQGIRPGATAPPAAPRPGAFGGVARGGDTRTFSARGQTSMGGGVSRGGGAPRGGGGGAVRSSGGGGGGHRR